MNYARFYILGTISLINPLMQFFRHYFSNAIIGSLKKGKYRMELFSLLTFRWIQFFFHVTLHNQYKCYSINLLILFFFLSLSPKSGGYLNQQIVTARVHVPYVVSLPKIKLLGRKKKETLLLFRWHWFNWLATDCHWCVCVSTVFTDIGENFVRVCDLL